MIAWVSNLLRVPVNEECPSNLVDMSLTDPWKDPSLLSRISSVWQCNTEGSYLLLDVGKLAMVYHAALTGHPGQPKQRGTLTTLSEPVCSSLALLWQ